MISHALERRYRRLLWAYPRTYRDRRGAEIVATYLDSAAPDQRRPRVADAADLVTGGIRQRLGLDAAPGFAEGLALVWPIALALATGASLGAWTRYGNGQAGSWDPYAFGLLAALLAWIVAEGVGRLLAVAAVVWTVAAIAVWSYTNADLLVVCVLGALVLLGAVAAPPGLRPARPAVLALAAATAVVTSKPVVLRMPEALGTDVYSESAVPALAAPVLVALALATAGAATVGGATTGAARPGRGAAWLWAAALLLPTAAFLLPYPLAFYDDPLGPDLASRWMRDGAAIAPAGFVALCLAVLVFGAARRSSLMVGAAAITHAAIAGLAGTALVLELTGGAPAHLIWPGYLALVVAAAGAGWLPVWPQRVLMFEGGLAMLFGFDRLGRNPLPAGLLLLAALALALPRPRPTRAWWPVLGVVLVPVAFLHFPLQSGGLYDDPGLELWPNQQSHLAALVPVVFAIAAAAALLTAVSGHAGRAGVVIALALLGYQLFLLPIHHPLVIGGVAGAGVAVIYATARVARRRTGTARIGT